MSMLINPKLTKNLANTTSTYTDFKDAYSGSTFLQSYATGSLMSDWTKPVAGSPATFQVDALVGSISGQAFHHKGTSAGSTGDQKEYIWSGRPTVINTEVLMSTYMTSLNSLQKMGCPSARISGSQYSYADPTSDNWRTIVSSNNGVSSDISSSTASAYDINIWYWQRFQFIGTAIKFKIWQRGSAEPGTWLISGTSSKAPAAGSPGMRWGMFNLLEGYCDWYSFSSDGTPAYGPV